MEARMTFKMVEQMPEFPRGQDALLKYLASNIKYPESARKAGIQGIVYINYVVEKDGSLSNMKVLRGIGNGCDEEALRVVSMMPKWKIGKQRGEAVAVEYNLPIKFSLK